jgi:pyruvate formate lyase activating enzyme
MKKMARTEKPVDPTVYSKLNNGIVQCRVCPTQCIIEPGKKGFCKTKLNKNGLLYTPNYGAVCYLGLDFIERTPLFHFWPGTQTLAVACPSCNFTCQWCTNWVMSQNTADALPDIVYPSIELILEKAKEWDCKSISYTYTEPSIWYDFALDVAKAAKKVGLFNVLKTNGYMSQEVLEKLAPYVDAVSIDVKGFSDEFYQKECCGRLKPVLDTARRLNELGKHVEIAYMILPGQNDEVDMIKDLSVWMVSALGSDVPLIFERFFPHYTLSA